MTSTEVVGSSNESGLFLAVQSVEKKVRNLEKRKGKLDAYREETRNGKELNQDQTAAVAKYDEVMTNLEFAKDLQTQFRNFLADEERTKKKQAKKEATERAKTETSRLASILVLQKLTAAFANNKVKEDFSKGEHGAIKLTKDQLNSIDEFITKTKSPTGSESALDETDKVYVASAEHLLSLAEAKAKKFNGKSTYKDLQEVFETIKKSDYDFEQAISNTNTANSSGASIPNVNNNNNSKSTPKKQAAPVPLTNGNKAEQSPVKEVAVPTVPQPTGVTAAAPPPATHAVPPPPNVVTNPPVFPAPPHMFSAPPTTQQQQPSINFLQESQINMDSPDMDPAVVMVHHSVPPPPTTTAPPQFVAFLPQSMPPTTLAVVQAQQAAAAAQQHHFGGHFQAPQHPQQQQQQQPQQQPEVVRPHPTEMVKPVDKPSSAEEENKKQPPGFNATSEPVILETKVETTSNVDQMPTIDDWSEDVAKEEDNEMNRGGRGGRGGMGRGRGHSNFRGRGGFRGGRGGEHNDRGGFKGNRDGHRGRGEGRDGHRGRGEGRGGYRGGRDRDGNFKDREFRQSNRGMNGGGHGGHHEDRRGGHRGGDGHRGQFRGGHHQQQNGFKEN